MTPWARLCLATSDLFVVAALSVPIDRARKREGPKHLIARLRRRGLASRRRDARGRRLLGRIVSGVDRFFPGGPNCYRRVLLEVALDAGAAEEPVSFALRVGGGPGTGHAWLGRVDHHPPPGYDAIFEL
jgi:hypothetical protein